MCMHFRLELQYLCFIHSDAYKYADIFYTTSYHLYSDTVQCNCKKKSIFLDLD